MYYNYNRLISIYKMKPYYNFNKIKKTHTYIPGKGLF